MGCYEALFLRGGGQPIARMLDKNLKPFLKCIHCEAPLRINKSNAAHLYLAEQMQCKTCGLISQAPLYWLFCVAKVSLTREEAPHAGKPLVAGDAPSIGGAPLNSNGWAPPQATLYAYGKP